MMSKSNPISLFNPFALSTFGIASIAWIIAFAGSIAADSQMKVFPKFLWWGIVFQLLLLITVVVFYTTNTFHFYRLFLTCCISIAFVYNSNSANNLVYYSGSAPAAASAGLIILCITNILWLFYFGSEPNSPIISYIDSFGGGSNIMMSSKRFKNNKMKNEQAQPPVPANYKEESLVDQDRASSLDRPTGNPFEHQNYSSQLNGLENASSNNRASFLHDDDYPIAVRGVYDYQASPDDINELSFAKGEVFRVKDTNGNWWQGKNSRGEIGMCPSNYLEVLN